MPADGEKHPKTFDITINGIPYTVSQRELTGAQLKQLGGVPESETLFLIHGAGHEERTEDDQVVKIRNRMAFESAPDGGVS